MKVISEGNLNWKHQVVCKLCEATLEIEQEDLQYEVSDEDAAKQYLQNEIIGTFSIECPKCLTKLIIKEKDIPPIIRNKIMYGHY